MLRAASLIRQLAAGHSRAKLVARSIHYAATMRRLSSPQSLRQIQPFTSSSRDILADIQSFEKDGTGDAGFAQAVPTDGMVGANVSSADLAGAKLQSKHTEQEPVVTTINTERTSNVTQRLQDARARLALHRAKHISAARVPPLLLDNTAAELPLSQIDKKNMTDEKRKIQKLAPVATEAKMASNETRGGQPEVRTTLIPPPEVTLVPTDQGKHLHSCLGKIYHASFFLQPETLISNKSL